MQQLKDKIVLVPFADRPQHGGQPVVQDAEPAEPVEPSHEIAVPADPPGSGERGAGSRLGLLGDCWRIVGLAAACLHKFPPWWRQLVLDSRESSSSWLILLVGGHVPRGEWLLTPRTTRFRQGTSAGGAGGSCAR